jgi:hypothetical protein
MNEPRWRGEMTGFLRLLRGAALFAVLAGAAGSLGFLLHAGRRTPRFLLVIFVFWVMAPFIALAWAHVVSKRWSVVTRAALYTVMLVLPLGSLIIYGDDAVRLRSGPRAFVYVLVPPVSCLLMAIVVPAAALISRRRSPRADRP